MNSFQRYSFGKLHDAGTGLPRDSLATVQAPWREATAATVQVRPDTAWVGSRL